MPDTTTAEVGRLTEADYDQWEVLFRAYIDFYKSSLSDVQYHNTFKRIIDPAKDLEAFVLRQGGKLIGIAHYFPHQNPWSEKPTMHLNGTNLHHPCYNFD